MNKLQLYNLVELSNDSKITRSLLNILNEKLTDTEMLEFKKWLNIIKNK